MVLLLNQEYHGLLIHRKRSPFPDKGRLNVFRLVVLCIFICLHTIVNKLLEAGTFMTSLPLSGKGDHEVVDE